MRRLAVALGVLSLAIAVLQASAIAQRDATRVVDRTFVCRTVATAGGQRDLDLAAVERSTSEYNGVQETVQAQLAVGSGPDTLNSDLAVVRAASVKGISEVFPAGVYVNGRRCVATRRSVALSPKGLSGPPVAWSKFLNCTVPGRVLIRVRATLEGPSSWGPADRVYVGVRKNVVDASLAVRSATTNAPIGYLQLASHATRLWYSSRCG